MLVNLTPFLPPGAGRPLRIFSLLALPKSVSGLDYPKTLGKMLDVLSQHRKDADLVIEGDFTC